MTQPLFSLHGINSEGEWQHGIQTVLDKFFQYTPLQYRQYRNLPLAVWRLGGDVLLLLIGVALPIFWLWTRPSVDAKWLLSLEIGFFVGAIVTNIYNRVCMQRVTEAIHSDIRAPLGGYGKPSIVAHSLGTLLISRALERFDGLSLDTVILHGCVVDRMFPWELMLNRIENVFNEIGGVDPVPWIAGVLRFSVPRIGTAGATGFSGPVVTGVHSNPSEVGPIIFRGECCCEAHKLLQSSDLVHNVRYTRVGHSGYHKGMFHAKDFWLPRLLGYDPILYRKFYEFCVEIVIAQRGLRYEYEERRKAFLGTCFGWHPGALRYGILAEIQETDGVIVPAVKVGELLNQIVHLLSKTVSDMLNLFPLPGRALEPVTLPPQGDKRWNLLDPRSALKASVEASLESWRTFGLL